MACRAALLAVLPSTGSALAVHKASIREVGLQDDTESLDLERMLMPAETDCQAAEAGSNCFKSVEYLRSQGFKAHPSWYPGYSSESSFEEVQDMLHGLEKAECPKPCWPKVSLARGKAAGVAKFDCRDTIEGDLCYSSIRWLKEVGFELHPDWYPGVDKKSSTASIQAALHRQGKSDCSQPCSPTEAALEEAEAPVEATAAETQERRGDDCTDAAFGTTCYTDVAYGMAEGIRKHPQYYEGVKEGATFKQIQEFLYLNNRSSCERPCPAERMSLDMVLNHYQELREKKKVQDMSIDELTRYLNGEWDGYVMKEVKSQNDHSTFEKRKGTPTAAPPAAAVSEPEGPATDSVEVAANNIEAAVVIEPEKPANDTAGVADSRAEEPASDNAEVADNHTEAPANDSADVVDNRTEELAIDNADVTSNHTEETVVETGAEFSADAEPLPDVASSAQEAAVAADTAEQEDAFPETAVVPSTDAGRLLLACLSKLQSVTKDTFGDIKAECEEKLPFEGADREALAKEAMRFFIWAQRHVQSPQAMQQAEAARAEAAAEAEAARLEEAKAKDRDVVGEPTPEIPSLDDAEVAAQEKPAETPEEMEQRLRKQLMEEMREAQTTTVAPHRETEEEMRERIKAEVMRELTMSKPTSD